MIRKETEIAGKKLILESGKLAGQANMAVKATYGDTVILVTVVAGDSNPEIDFLPLTVSYEEKLYASGSIKTSRFVKRDGKPTDDAVVSKRLIDHAIRPLFPTDYMDEVQIIATVLSLDETADPEFLSMIATSAALHASDIPWNGPLACARIGYTNNEFLLNPPTEIIETISDLNLFVSFVGKNKRLLALEAEANILPEEVILNAITYARDHINPVMTLIDDFAREVNPQMKKYEYVSKALSPELIADVSTIAKTRVMELIQNGSQSHREVEIIKNNILSELFTTLEGKYKKSDMVRAYEVIERHALQQLILEEGKRPDGRKFDQVRNITSEIEVLPRTHGSALFTRGQTQTLSVATLGAPSLQLFIQNMYGERTKRFIHYYNFPPFCTGEAKRIGPPGSREIGHGMLAEKALRAVIPDQNEFPYMIILVSETLSSRGSSSMAATCASSLALMDAGVPIKDTVGGIATGLILNDDLSKHVILTDIAYKEDAFGFLDFKMAGTKTGVTAIQVDMKIDGIDIDLLPKIVEQSRNGRLHVIGEMEKTISKSKDKVSKYAPKMLTLKVEPEKIGVIIGSGGRTIRELQDKTKSEITIEEDGSVVVSALNETDAQIAVDYIMGLIKDVKVGEIYEGEVKEIVDFGAFVEILPGKIGLLHISELANVFVAKVEDHIKLGEKVKVKVLDVNAGKISLSKKALEPGAQSANPRSSQGRHGSAGSRRPSRNPR